MDTGTVFGLAGLVVALVSLVYVRTQAAASRMQAEASAEQTRITRRIAALEASLRLEDRAFELRREMGDHPAFLEAYFRANPQLQQVIERAGGFQTAMMIRRMIDTTQDIHVLRREGVITDEHWRTWIAAFPPWTKMAEFQVVFDSAVARGIYDGAFVDFCRAVARGETPSDPGGGPTAPL
jgi:hypothetical protein